MKKCYLVLADGHVFEGVRFGAEGNAIGELVFNTGMVDYCNTLTDPNNYGQIVLQTFPMIGNYGIIPEDMAGKKCHMSGYVVREYCEAPSNFRCKGTLDEYLKEQNVVGVYGVDTREITRILRDKGVMNARIVDEISENPAEGLCCHTVSDAVCAVAAAKKEVVSAAVDKKYTVAMYSFGTHGQLIEQLSKRGCEVHVFPANTSAEELLAVNPDGVLLSDGPGNPAENASAIAQISALLGKTAIFGVGLGHQLLALAKGGKTFKLQYGHRGANQPVKRLEDGRTFITTQNHGYAVDAAALPEGAFASYVNANDHTCEGVEYANIAAFGVQFHPITCTGPQDTSFIYEHFIALMNGSKAQ